MATRIPITSLSRGTMPGCGSGAVPPRAGRVAAAPPAAADMEPVLRVGIRVAGLRRRRGLTQADLAERIDRSVEAVSSIERGRHLPSLGILQLLATALDAPIGDFFPRPGEADSPKHAALFGELLDTARTLPLADLEMATRIVAIVARRYADGR